MRLFYFFFITLGIISAANAQAPCSQSFGSAGPHKIPIDNGSLAAVDVDVEAATAFTVDELEISFHTDAVPIFYNITAYFYNEELGDLIEYQELTPDFPTSTTPGIWKMKLTIPEPVMLTAGQADQKYWIAITAFSDNTSEPIYMASVPYTGSSGEPAYYSPDGGETWTTTVPGVSGEVEGAVKVIGICEDIELPQEDCVQGVPSNNFENGASINGNWSKAIDLVLESSQDFLLKEMEVNVFTAAETDITSVDVFYYENDNGLPGGSHGGYTWVGEQDYWTEQPDTQAVFFISGDCEFIGTPDFNGSSITLYPNPVTDMLNIKSTVEIESIEGFTITGMRIFSQTNPSSSIDIRSLSTGTYIFKIISKDGKTENFKVIKRV